MKLLIILREGTVTDVYRAHDEDVDQLIDLHGFEVDESEEEDNHPAVSLVATQWDAGETLIVMHYPVQAGIPLLDLKKEYPNV
uniref:Uncharacterized protein n=1 Tax=viral metagenome TaxID=1070528 RepID=A0A6M3L5D3_9ZZZZ